jgi:hypothetical protein
VPGKRLAHPLPCKSGGGCAQARSTNTVSPSTRTL